MLTYRLFLSPSEVWYVQVLRDVEVVTSICVPQILMYGINFYQNPGLRSVYQHELLELNDLLAVAMDELKEMGVVEH